MVHVVNLVMSVMVVLRVPDMEVNPYQLSGRRDADDARDDPLFQAIPSVGTKDVLLPHRCRSLSRRRPIEPSPMLRTAWLDEDRLWGEEVPTPA
jgi:hypothetical protein